MKNVNKEFREFNEPTFCINWKTNSFLLDNTESFLTYKIKWPVHETIRRNFLEELYRRGNI